ncbi:hypothetical protein F1D05_10125 [Kribbella qitaiheensis]|uniref:Abi family protein n=1 Tax=Kribbella qitaiheensis TaxID=1544730 RepID=A0A7G6WW21_9ACTN|nr:Abi family protein [Kribbella qitaiheensis]QNE18186.1 hypothetical protein F1D05_10125 [Kribbella qitaiheensis]
MAPPTQPSIRRAAIAARLSTPRLAPYLSATNGNLRDALRLYDWNVEISGAFYESLHQFEVVLRNALDEELSAWNALQTNPATGAAHSRDWLMDPSHLLLRLTQNDIPKAQQRARSAVRRTGQRGRRPGHSDVLAQLSFGTWRFLLPDNDPGRQLLWQQSLDKAFPLRACTPQDLVKHVDGIHRLRNRIAHLEPLVDSVMVADRLASMRTVAASIDPIAETWIVSRQRITPLLRTKPIPATTPSQP